MSTLITVAASVVAFLVAVVLARPIGRRLKSVGVWALGLTSVVFMGAGMAALVWGAINGQDLWWGVGVGFGLGGVSGLRYGRGTLLTLLSGQSHAAGDRQGR